MLILTVISSNGKVPKFSVANETLFTGLPKYLVMNTHICYPVNLGGSKFSQFGWLFSAPADLPSTFFHPVLRS